MNTFRLTDKHIKLLRNANITWADIESGAPAIDGKRPYGNSSVESDIIRILFGELPGQAEVALYDYARQLHGETKIALQIILTTGQFKPGMYVSDNYQDNWREEEA